MTEEKEPKEEKKQGSNSEREESEDQAQKKTAGRKEPEDQEKKIVSDKEKSEDQVPENAPARKESEGQLPEEEKTEEEIPTPESAPLFRHFLSGLRILIAGLVIFAVIYPSVLLLAGNLFWGDKSEGGIVNVNGKNVGAGLIGQPFTSERFFHPRPSSKGYNGTNSGSQNLGPYNEVLTERVRMRLKELENEGITVGTVPVGWVTESGSALDPHITPLAALLQLPRVSRASGLPRNELEKLIDEHTEGKLMGLFGQERVNVLLLNLKIHKRLGDLNE